MQPTSRIAIVGAGITGLAAGVTLAEAGRDCLLLEQAPAVGGLARSQICDDVTFDYGPHVLFDEPGPGGRLLRETLTGLPVFSRRFAFAIESGGRLWRFPNHGDIPHYPWRYTREIIAGLLAPRRPVSPSARDELTAKTGAGLYELLFQDLLRKKTALDGAALHRHWLMRPGRTVHGELEPPAPGRSRLGMLLGILNRLRRRYIYPAQGFGALAEALAARYIRAGGRLLPSCGPVSLERAEGRIEAVTAGGGRMPVAHVIWTAPLSRLRAALGLAKAPGLRFEDILLVLATYDCPKPPHRPFVYVYHPDPSVVFNRSSYPTSLFREHGPAGREGLCFEITPGAMPGDRSSQSLAERAVADAERIGLHPVSRLRELRTVALPEALPVYGLDYETHLANARKDLRSVGNLLSVGRLGGWHFCMAPEAAAQGIKAARHLLEASGDREDRT